MSIQRVAAGWKVRWRTPDGTHHAKTFRKGEKKLAQDFEKEADRAKRLGYLPRLQACDKTISEAGIEWAEAQAADLAPRTAQLYAQTWRSHVAPHLGGTRLGDLTVADVEKWLADLDTGPTAKRRSLQILTRVYNRAMRNGDVHANPCQLARKPRVRRSPEPIYAPPPACRVGRGVPRRISQYRVTVPARRGLAAEGRASAERKRTAEYRAVCLGCAR